LKNDSLRIPLLGIQNDKPLLTEMQYARPHLDDIPPPTYDDAEDMVVCVGQPVEENDTDDSLTTKEGSDNNTEEEESEDEEDDPIVIVEHKVQKNDTLLGIALRYHTSVSSLKAKNQFPCSHFWMVPNGILKIPIKKSLLGRIAFPEVKKMTAEEFAQSVLCERQEKIRQFMRLTNTKRAEAVTYLELHDFHLRVCAFVLF